MIVGLQGSGKTTSTGKIARWLAANQDRKPLLLSVDVYRPAAREQLKVIARATGQQIFEQAETNDPLLGLHVAAAMDLREIGLLFYLAASSETVAEALEYLARYAATATAEIRMEISRQKDETLLTFHRVLGFDEPTRQQSELLALGFLSGRFAPTVPVD